MKALTRTPYAYGSTTDVTVNKPACPKQAFAVNDKAWNNKGSILSTLFVGLLTREGIIKTKFLAVLF